MTFPTAQFILPGYHNKPYQLDISDKKEGY